MTLADRRDLPTVEADTQPYWDAIRDRGVLLIAHCTNCDRVHHYPRPFCPSCWSRAVEPRPASGRASLYTFSTVYVNDLPPFADRVPYVAALVELEEGPRLMTTIVDCVPADLRIGMALTVRAEPLDETLSAPVFVPA